MESECPVKPGKEPNRKVAFSIFFELIAFCNYAIYRF